MLDGFQAGLSWITILRKAGEEFPPRLSTISIRPSSRATARRKTAALI